MDEGTVSSSHNSREPHIPPISMAESREAERGARQCGGLLLWAVLPLVGQAKILHALVSRSYSIRAPNVGVSHNSIM
jgi:hypothetical protein